MWVETALWGPWGEQGSEQGSEAGALALLWRSSWRTFRVLEAYGSDLDTFLMALSFLGALSP